MAKGQKDEATAKKQEAETLKCICKTNKREISFY